MVHTRQACSKPFTSKVRVSLSKKCARLMDARLHAVLSRNMYSEHGLDALIRPDSGQVCQSLMVVSNCTPGSAECQAASATRSHSAAALTVLIDWPVVRAVSAHSRS